MRITVFTAVAAVAAALLLAAGAAPSRADDKPTADKSGIEHRRTGSGRPLVVLQSGLGDRLQVWQPVQDALGTNTTSVSFNRPGYGASRRAGGERSPCRAAEEQRAFLRSAGFAPPYVVVGHSLGGLYQFAFAKLFPDDVAGIVLLDPTHPDHLASLERDAPMMATLVRVARARWPEHMRREFDDQSACLDRLRDAPLPRVPVRLLVRGEFRGAEAGTFETVVHRLEADWVRLLGIASAQRVQGAGHTIQRDRPQAVSDAIVAVSGASPGR